jgi:hypothetical protein
MAASADCHRRVTDRRVFETAVLDTAAMTGLITVTLQIAYLPALYAAFNRRENEIALLNSRLGTVVGAGIAGQDPLCARLWHLGTGCPARHLQRVGAALYLSLCPLAAPAVPARLCLRSGLLCFSEVARSMGIKAPAEPAPDAVISLTYAEFLDAVGRLRELNFPIEREPEAAWPHFVGWRVNYEQAAYAIAAAIDAVPALWSGPRRRPVEPMPPLRPRPGVPFP